MVEKAVVTVQALPRLERCTDADALRAEVPPPEDPALAERVAALDRQLVAASVKEEAGKRDEALKLVREVIAEGASLDHEPLLVRARLRLGSLQEDADDPAATRTLELALDGALAHGMTVEAASASRLLVLVIGSNQQKLNEAQTWIKMADPLARAVGTPDALADWLNLKGNLALAAGDAKGARAYHERAMETQVAAHGADYPKVTVSLSGLGNVAHFEGESRAAAGSSSRLVNTTRGRSPSMKRRSVRTTLMSPERSTASDPPYSCLASQSRHARTSSAHCSCAHDKRCTRPRSPRCASRSPSRCGGRVLRDHGGSLDERDELLVEFMKVVVREDSLVDGAEALLMILKENPSELMVYYTRAGVHHMVLAHEPGPLTLRPFEKVFADYTANYEPLPFKLREFDAGSRDRALA